MEHHALGHQKTSQDESEAHKERCTINRGEHKLRLYGGICRMSDSRLTECSESWNWMDRTSEEDQVGNEWTTLRDACTQQDGRH